MARGDLRKLFENICVYSGSGASDLAEGEDRFSFIWHGGEPFMQPMSYYDQIGDIQKESIPDTISYHNSVQTNLTILTDLHLRHLVDKKFFASVGFSFDVYGDSRVDIAGRNTTEKILKNIQKLKESEIETGAITVLSKSTFPHFKNIFKFFEGIDTSFRILPYHIETLESQTDLFGLLPSQISSTMCDIFDLWFVSKSNIFVSPLDLYLATAVSYLKGVRDIIYNPFADENVFIVETNGETYGYESYGGGVSYGNLFSQPFEEILTSENRRMLARKAKDRMDRSCVPCKFFGACSGHPVAVANPLEEKWLAASGCYVKPIIAHIVDRLIETDAVRLGMNTRPFRVPNAMSEGHT